MTDVLQVMELRGMVNYHQNMYQNYHQSQITKGRWGGPYFP